MKQEHILQLKALLGDAIACDVPMCDYTSFKIGGKADCVLFAKNAQQIRTALQFCAQHELPYFVMSNGSNLLVSDRGMRQLVIMTRDGFDDIYVEGNTIAAGAGAKLAAVAEAAADHGLTGLEFAFGIPGRLGGALTMNAGAYGGEMAQVVERIDGVTADGTPVTLNADELALGYRHSALMDRADDERVIVTGVYFKLNRGEQGAIAARMKELIGKRQEKQPLEFPSAGSFFKRPQGHFAGALVEQAGLKGYRVGDAQVSEKHAGFVVNRGNATAKDLCQLCEDVQAAVWKSAKVRLEPEVRFVGEF